MNGNPPTREASPMDGTRQQARQAGLLYGLVALTAPIGLMVVPGQLLDMNDAAATAARIASHEPLWRLGLACELFHQTVEVFLVLVLFRLFRPVNLPLARQMAILGWMPIPIVFLNVLNEIAAWMLATEPAYLAVLSPAQRDAAVLFFIRLHGHGLDLAGVFWGLWLIPLGLLVWRCGFMPKVLGLLVVAAGLGYVIGSFTTLIVPPLAPSLSTLVFVLETGEVLLILWLLLFGARGQAPGRCAQA